jgi:hypothetical protein
MKVKAELLTPVEEIPVAESNPPFFKAARRYQDNDFRLLYEREYHAHKETRRKLEAAEAEIVYLKQRMEKLEADNAYL